MARLDLEKPRVSIIGDGQLARMEVPFFHQFGYDVAVLGDPKPAEISPAAQAGAIQVRGNLYDPAAIRRLARASVVIGNEIEHFNTNTVRALENEGHLVIPRADAVAIVQDKRRQKRFLQSHDIAVVPFAEVGGAVDIHNMVDAWGRLVVKKAEGGYDGRGNWVVNSHDDVEEALERLGIDGLYVEQFFDFEREIAVLTGIDQRNNLLVYPPVETVHRNNICHETLMRARISSSVEAQATSLAVRAARELDIKGVSAYEMFVGKDEKVVINEIATRVHNSYHVSDIANVTSQFEQQARILVDREMGSADMLTKGAAMVNILGEQQGVINRDELRRLEQEFPGVKITDYGKSWRLDRKLGHISAMDDTAEGALEKARAVRLRISA